jgi:L-alanine-DL-glutamate epimerase-like enolase superfamily enzyme
MQRLTVAHESWPVAGSFTISRGSRTTADVVVVTVERDGTIGRGECVPYRHYGESVESVMAALEERRQIIEGGVERSEVPALLAPKAARNALDCALWDLACKRVGKRIWEMLGQPEPQELVTAFTISLDTPEKMAAAASKAADRPLLKLKLGGNGDIERLREVRNAAPRARLIVDANEGWRSADLPKLFDACAETQVEMIEQPLPAGHDNALHELKRVVPVCADESAHDESSLPDLQGKYDLINIKLDKTGGLTQALALRRAAEGLGFGIMVGCMLATSLSMAPAFVVAQGTKFVDLDGPLLLACDREPAIRYQDGFMYPPESALWG